jgi:poly(hydroxyalkanoate) granule-associated protein
MAVKRKSRSGRTPREATRNAQARLLGTLHEVWLAGLGAASKAQSGAPELWQELISEGARVHGRTRDATEKLARAWLGGVQSRINTHLGEVQGKTTDVLDNLEKIFQTRVHRALTQLGVPSAEEVAALSRRVDALNSGIDKLARNRKAPRAQRRTVRRAVAARAH